MKLGQLLAHLEELEAALAADLRAAAERHRDDHDVYHQCHTFAVTADKRVEALGPLKHDGTRARPPGRPRSETAAPTCSRISGRSTSARRKRRSPG